MQNELSQLMLEHEEFLEKALDDMELAMSSYPKNKLTAYVKLVANPVIATLTHCYVT